MTGRAFAWYCMAAVVSMTWLSGCSKMSNPWEGKGGPPRVLTSFPPIYCFVKNVAGEHAGLISLCTTTGPHHYQYNVQDLLFLANADLFFANGLGLDEQFTDKLYKGRTAHRLRYVKLGDVLPDKLLIHTDKDGHQHTHADGTKCEHGDHDPHVWLGIPQALAMVERIRDELKQADPRHAADYDANAADYANQLEKLHADGKKLLATKKDRKLLTFHESLAYFAHADSFDLKVAGVIMEGPGDEPTSPRLGQLLDLIVKDKVRALAVEPQYPTTNSAHVLLNELQRKGLDAVALIEIDPLETASEKELQDPRWYVRKMRANLDNLVRALP